MTCQHVTIVYGTRPEAIKLFLIVRLLGGRARLINTQQHFDAELAANITDDVGMRYADDIINMGGLDRGTQLGRATEQLTGLLQKNRPRVVVVQGDTNSALAGALAANAERIPVLHVEAGLRSRDRRMPEEHNRILIDHLADVCAAPTQDAQNNLAAEGIQPPRAVITGNTIVEATRELLPGPAQRERTLKELGIETGAFVLATFHRPENVDDPDRLAAILRALHESTQPVLLPLHPRTRSRIEKFGLTGLLASIRTVPPLRPRPFLSLAREATVIASDSGGLQEEATILGTPALVVRPSTERPEALTGATRLVEPTVLASELSSLRPRPAAASPVVTPFGDGTASVRIVELLMNRFCGMGGSRQRLLPLGGWQCMPLTEGGADS